MAVVGAGASFKVATAAFVLTEIAHWLTEIGGDDSTDELDGSTFSPGALTPNKVTFFGATERTLTLQGRWSPETQVFFKALSGLTSVAFEWCPEGTAVGKLKIFGTVNVGPWPTPQQAFDGVVGFTVVLKVVQIDSETIITPPATIAITSSSVANPTVITSAAHGLSTGDVVLIAGHTGATPAINGTHGVTVLSTTTFSIPVSVTVGGTGGTLQD